jgi:hypothetical protein
VTVSIPPGLTIDTARLAAGGSADENMLGTANFSESGGNYYTGNVVYGSSTTVRFVTSGSGVQWSAASPVNPWANGDRMAASFSVPISGWAATDIVTPESSISGQARYTTNAAQNIPNASLTVVNFEDKSYDINNEVTTGAGWIFTAKTSGKYQVNAQVLLNTSAAWGAGDYATIIIGLNGSTYSTRQIKYVDATVTQEVSISISDIVPLEVGDTVSILVGQYSGTNITLYASGVYNSVSISKVTGPGSQSFYISSPLVAPPDGTGIKLKNSTNTDVMTVSDAGAAVITATSGVGLIVKGSGTTSSSSNQIWRASDNTTLGYVENGGAWTFNHNDASTGDLNHLTLQKQGNTRFSLGSNSAVGVTYQTSATGYGHNFLTVTTGTVGGYTALGAWTLGPSSGSTQVSHTVYGYSNAITWGNGTFNVSNRNGSNAATIVFANGTTKISNWASSSTYPFSAANSGGADTIAVHANGIYGYNAGTMRAVGVTSGNVLGDTTVSKRDLKKNIVDSKYGLKTATLLKMREFDWKASGQHDIGAIADEVADVAPILAYFGKDGVAEGVNYTKLAVVAIKAIQEQQVQIACLVNADTKKQRQACVK